MTKRMDYSVLLGKGNPLLRYPRLKEAAIDEFSRKSFQDASLNDILKNAGMSKGSLYHHFGDKFGLYVALVDLIIGERLSFFYPLLRHGTDTSDFFGTLKKIMQANLAFMAADERMHHLSNRLMEEKTEFRNRVLGFFVPDYFQVFSSYVAQAVESGQIDRRFSPKFVAQVVEIMLANIHRLVSTGEPEEQHNTAQQVVHMLQYGISSERNGV